MMVDGLQYASLEYGTRPDLNERDHSSCMALYLERQQVDARTTGLQSTWKGKGNKQKLQNKKHTNEVSKNGKPR